MTGRAKRAQRLMPSFLMVAGLVGCSGRTVDDNPAGGGAAGGGGGGSGTVSQGGRRGDVDCPEQYTSDPRACAVEGMECTYDERECSTALHCEAGVWVDYSPSCNPPELVDCPPELPSAGAWCDSDLFVEDPEECAYSVAGCGRVEATCNLLEGAWVLHGSCAGGHGGAPSDAGAAGANAGGGGHEGGAGGQGGGG